MKHIALLFLTALFSVSMTAQDRTTVEATSSEVSDNLDLEAVASVFADAEDLESFERTLNDPEERISNLDLNQDGYVDYLRVVELAEGRARVITIQAVLAKDMYQDVATVEVEQDERGKTRVQVVGDVYMYGDNYVIEPVYRYRPVIYSYLWAPRVRPWCSAYSWGYYPSYWSYWAPVSFGIYWSHLSFYRHHHQFYYRPYRANLACGYLYKSNRRNDYGKANPQRGFKSRNEGYANKQDYDQRNKSTKQMSPSARAGVTADKRTSSQRSEMASAQSIDRSRASGQSRTQATGAKTESREISTRTKDQKPSATQSRTTRQETSAKPDYRVQQPVDRSNTSSRTQKPAATSQRGNTSRSSATSSDRARSTSSTTRSSSPRVSSSRTERPSASSSSTRSSSRVNRSTPSSSRSSARTAPSTSRSSARTAPSSSRSSGSMRSSSSSRSSSAGSSRSSSSRSSSSKGSSSSRSSRR